MLYKYTTIIWYCKDCHNDRGINSNFKNVCRTVRTHMQRAVNSKKRSRADKNTCLKRQRYNMTT